MIIDHEHVSRWLDDYVAAWQSYEREAIAALFNAEVEYRYQPYDEPLRGRDAVIASWLGDDDHEGASSRDQPGTYDASYRPLAVDGEVAVAVGSSSYRERPDGPIVRVYDNCFVIRFDAEGRCRAFTEWFMQRPNP